MENNENKQDYKSMLDLVETHLKPKSKLTLKDRWYMCKYLTWEQNWKERGMDQAELIDNLRELFSYLNYTIPKQEDIDFKQIESYEPYTISKNLKLTLYKNHKVKISHVKKPKPNEKNILKEAYEIYKKFDTSDYYKYL